jgi:hypothetical protein
MIRIRIRIHNVLTAKHSDAVQIAGVVNSRYLLAGGVVMREGELQ